ncbi:pre-mRNA-splicing factor SYF1-like, partial [Pezoporus wallicus]|uniref:pre-mRNA-splicing factor SYF1-like n=1 Tax=Pezoporus wallicus TaxID=35540 RepID=UPI00254F1F87
MLADLEESLGTFQSTKAVYERILDLRIATPQIVINYGLCLEERGYFEESFKAYERGVSLFRWPAVADIWLTYLTKFVARYGGRKLERARDLFEQALDGCPPRHAKTIYLLYAKLEEDFGLARHAIGVYAIYLLYAKLEEDFGLARHAIGVYGSIYLLYAKLEEDFGLARHAIGVYG